MNNQQSFFALLLSLMTLCGCGEQVRKSQVTTSEKPNVIVILVDDMGYSDVGFNGCQDIPTPHIDRIAHQGVRFTNGYVSYAVCGPSRAGLLTGRYQDRFGFGRNPLFAVNDINQGLPLSEQTLASALAPAGYQSMAIGKWHLGAHEALRPLKRGFDEFFGFLTGGHQYFPKEWTLNDVSEVQTQFGAYRTKLLRNDQRVEESAYLTDALSREAVSFIGRNKEQPFFLYLAYNAPHGPLQATQKYLDRFQHIENKKRKTYAAMVSAVDDGVGQILAQLELMDMVDNTVIVFLSDNGGPASNGSENTPLRGYKGDLSEGGIRVPFAMQWSGKIPAGLVYDLPVISLDIFSTVVSHAGVLPKNPLDGVNLIPYLRGENTSAPHQHLFWRKYDANQYAIRAGQMKYLYERGHPSARLFDLSEDIGESKAIDQPSRSAQLEEHYGLWEGQLMDPIFLGLKQDDEYNRLHPKRFITEAY